jgi:hypothetical protein
MTSILHGIFLGTAVVLVVLGAAKMALASAASNGPPAGTRSIRNRLITIHEDFPRTIGATEALCGVLALVFAQFVWPAILVTGLGMAFVGVLVVRLRVMPGSGCGCIKAASKEPYLALSSVCRSAAMCAGGISGLVAGSHLRVDVVAGVAGGAWLLLLAALSPETWQYLNVRCGRPLVFAVLDDRRRLERSPGYRRLRDGGLITTRPTDIWSEGCVRYFAFAMIEHREQPQIAIFQVGPSGVLGRVMPRPEARPSHGPATSASTARS